MWPAAGMPDTVEWFTADQWETGGKAGRLCFLTSEARTDQGGGASDSRGRGDGGKGPGGKDYRLRPAGQACVGLFCRDSPDREFERRSSMRMEARLEERHHRALSSGLTLTRWIHLSFEGHSYEDGGCPDQGSGNDGAFWLEQGEGSV